MAFNFNWSPLTADASFYVRAQELLTVALNKSPKPPIIVDDILVNELNLGSVPPDLEILEVGDLAEDRFRGIFKMCYAGDAFLTLKTRVQANSLNTYLSTKPSFTSPHPLAAASGLTIPIQITLSAIQLSAFIILVFSKQKGLTLVFRNDPLESLKVSSTFDSIPFVREYLQKVIESQLRTLLMDEVPAIIHRLSLQLWAPEYRVREGENGSCGAEIATPEEKAVDPLASPPQDPVDLSGHVLDASQIASLSLDPGSETYSLFSQKNLIRLQALTNSHRTLSLFTPNIRDAVFRAGAALTERAELYSSNSNTSTTPALSRSHSYHGSTSTTYVFSDNLRGGPQSTRPNLPSFGSTLSGLGVGSHRYGKPHGGRKRKHHVVNLRKKGIASDDRDSAGGEESVDSETTSSALSVHSLPVQQSTEREEELVTPPGSPEPKTQVQRESKISEYGKSPLQPRCFAPCDPPQTKALAPKASGSNQSLEAQPPLTSSITKADIHSGIFQHLTTNGSKQRPTAMDPQTDLQTYPGPQPPVASFPYNESTLSGVLEQAWVIRMANEIARRMDNEKGGDRGFWTGRDNEETPPPAYGS